MGVDPYQPMQFFYVSRSKSGLAEQPMAPMDRIIILVESSWYEMKTRFMKKGIFNYPNPHDTPSQPTPNTGIEF